MRFRELLDSETDPQRRSVLSRLLSEATRELARLERIWLWTCPNVVVREDVGVEIEETLASLVAANSADFGTVQFLCHPTNKLYLIAQKNLPGPAVEKLAVTDVQSNTVCAEYLTTKTEIVVSDAETDYRFQSVLSWSRALGIRVINAIPVIGNDARLIGILSTQYVNIKIFSALEEQNNTHHVNRLANLMKCIE